MVVCSLGILALTSLASIGDFLERNAKKSQEEECGWIRNGWSVTGRERVFHAAWREGGGCLRQGTAMASWTMMW